MSLKTRNCYAEDVFRMFSRHFLGDFIEEKICWLITIVKRSYHQKIAFGSFGFKCLLIHQLKLHEDLNVAKKLARIWTGRPK